MTLSHNSVHSGSKERREMRLVRYGVRGAERPGLLDQTGVLRDLSPHLDDITPGALRRNRWRGLLSWIRRVFLLFRASRGFGVPVAHIPKFIGIGLNYADHAIEAGLEPPPEPIFFMKAISCLNGPDDDVILPRGSQKSDWEVELGVVIGKTARYVEQSRCAGPCGRLCAGQRRVRARISERAGLAMGQRQRLRHVRARRSLAGHQGRNSRSANS